MKFPDQSVVFVDAGPVDLSGEAISLKDQALETAYGYVSVVLVFVAVHGECASVGYAVVLEEYRTPVAAFVGSFRPCAGLGDWC